MSHRQKQRQGIWGKYDIALFVLNRNRAELYEKIENRVEDMMAEGLVAEIENLKKAQWSLTAREIIGVREVHGFLNQEYDLDQMKKLIKANTRHLAKRQLTWFRREKRFSWIMVNKGNAPGEIAQQLMGQWTLREVK